MKKIRISLLQISLLFISSFLLNGCTKPHSIQGYIEAELIYLSSTSTGILNELKVHRGQNVFQGDTLFALDNTKLMENIKVADNEIARAQAYWQDLTKGKRKEELDILSSQKIQAHSQYDNALLEYNRAKILVKSGAINQSTFDTRAATKDVAKARLDEINATIDSARLGAREDQLAMALSAIDSAKSKKIELERTLKETQLNAPDEGVIENTYFLPGENVPAGRPVVSLLSPKNIKVRFFIPQAKLPTLSLGDKIEVDCEGCEGKNFATVGYISPKAEFTPPNIYSNQNREKFTFMVEAYFDEKALPFYKVGMPVEVIMP